MAKRIIVLLNPVSGRNKANNVSSSAHFALSNIRAPFEVRLTQPGQIAAQAQEAAQQADLIIAMGGDGTLHAVAQGLVGSEAALGLIPQGTGNDFARTIGIRSVEQAIEVINTCSPVETDLIRYRTSEHEGYSINVSGIGFDATVAERINSGFRHLKGTTAYVAAVVQCLLRFRPQAFRVTIDGNVHEVHPMLCAIANARCYGGGMKIAPNAYIDDGLLDVVIVDRVSKIEFLLQFPRVFKGTHQSHRKVSSYRAQKVTLECDQALPILADGEIVGTTPATFEIVPKAILMVRPTQ